MITHTAAALSPLGVTCALLYAVAAVRLCWYRPNGARHRWGVSGLAAILIGAWLCRAIELLTCQQAASVPELASMAVIAAGVLAVRGNLARLLPERRHG